MPPPPPIPPPPPPPPPNTTSAASAASSSSLLLRRPVRRGGRRGCGHARLRSGSSAEIATSCARDIGGYGEMGRYGGDMGEI